MPENPLDDLINRLGGPSEVAEMTGRKGRLIRDEYGRTVYAKRNEDLRDADGKKVSMEKVNLQEKENFMNGSKLVAIISEAASSGISLQADRRVATHAGVFILLWNYRGLPINASSSAGVHTDRISYTAQSISFV